MTLLEQEKKVEFIELIYDLIFVYIIGRNNHLLGKMENGFIDPDAVLTYILVALIILQVWFYTTLLINRYGDNDMIMHIGIFVNMYLLYFMARGIRADWQGDYYVFNGAWVLILLNIALQYYLQMRKTSAARPWERSQIQRNIITILIQAAVIIISFPIFHFTGVPVSPLAMAFGIVMAIVGTKVNILVPVDFGHLTERVMLFVVFTFGEMVIGITDYFDGDMTLNVFYYSACAFLIVVGMFTSYELLYDKIIDRNAFTNGTGYMMMHVFLILAMNNITAALGFMRDSSIRELPKNILLVASFIVFYIVSFLIMRSLQIPKWR